MTVQTILCQPDSSKGCSVCCGLFNHQDISRENLNRFLSGGHTRTEQFSAYDLSSEERPNMQKKKHRDITSHICPFQGFIADRRPGCRIHPEFNSSDLRNRSLFGAKICSSYLCPAHEILSENQKMILVQHVHDWYCYSIAILDPESFIWINKIMEEQVPSCDAGSYSDILTQCLSLHGRHLQRYSGPLFHYSLSEYKSALPGFSLGHDVMVREREAVVSLIQDYGAGL